MLRESTTPRAPSGGESAAGPDMTDKRSEEFLVKGQRFEKKRFDICLKMCFTQASRVARHIFELRRLLATVRPTISHFDDPREQGPRVRSAPAATARNTNFRRLLCCGRTIWDFFIVRTDCVNLERSDRYRCDVEMTSARGRAAEALTAT
ncbi:hypothetical protein EVAR_33442_1 [Eumeta japonica]|uniref:Uncharacterized protein n=1 Tax=Eumeta variegata TaxID=151549 RepID=A0A4C1W1R7_EUMVA|nr:hypothetical protein EVAR_33442_1 [Eumeta japonica]